MSAQNKALHGRKVLFANFPADGHFNPLTGLAVHLKWMGCDVRWYTSSHYAPKLRKLGIQHYPLIKAVDASDLENSFPERFKIKNQIKKLRYDMIHAFVLRGSEYYEDLKDIHEEFPFEAVIADCAFTGIPFIKDKMGIPVLSIGVMPLTETSVDLPPAGLGLTPSRHWAGRLFHRLLRKLADRIIFGEPNRVMWKMLDEYGIDHGRSSLFDMVIKKSSLHLQSGTASFEYRRSDLGSNIRFIGSLLPFRNGAQAGAWYDPRLQEYAEVVLVTQGTVEKDVDKLLIPTLEAFRGSDTLVVATTGGSQTSELRQRFNEPNFIIEDFIPFADVMPYAHVFVSNGGYGGVMLGIEYGLPLVVAGVHEGKNEINARIGYFKLGINLKTERPRPEKIREAVDAVFNNSSYRENVAALRQEFSKYDPAQLCATYLKEVLEARERQKPVKNLRVVSKATVG
ncbi:MAG: glycosyltransferase [Chitinophagaceae bacterium]